MSDENLILSKTIKGYRAGETLPLKLNRQHILNIVQGLPIAKEAGMPEIGITDYTKKVLLEGREDAGTNEFNHNNPRANKLYETAVANGANRVSAAYGAAVLDKSEVAKRLNIPFELAWNGTGRTKDGSADGQRHAARAESFSNVEADPRNADLVDSVRRGISGNLSPQERILMLTDDKLTEAVFGKVSEFVGDKNLYTKSAIANANSVLNSRISELRPEDRSKITTELGGTFMATDLLRNFAGYYKQAANIGKPDTETRSAGYTAIMDSIVGKDPDMSAYKAATAQRFPPTAPSESAMSSIINAVKSLFQ